MKLRNITMAERDQERDKKPKTNGQVGLLGVGLQSQLA